MWQHGNILHILTMLQLNYFFDVLFIVSVLVCVLF